MIDSGNPGYGKSKLAEPSWWRRLLEFFGLRPVDRNPVIELCVNDWFHWAKTHQNDPAVKRYLQFCSEEAREEITGE